MSDRKLTAPRYRLWMADDTEYEVQITNADMVSFDRERTRHRDWPNVTDGVFFFQNYVCWRAATRLELLKLTLAEFEKEVIQIQPVQDDDQGDDVDPTQPGAVPAWSLPSP